MKLECTLNHLQCELLPPIEEWWFDIGFTYQTTPYYCVDKSPCKYVVTIGLLFFSIYIRW